jgi:hypothetical protein
MSAISTLEGQKYVTQSLILAELCLIEQGAKKVKEQCMFFSVSSFTIYLHI